jgi:uncharacterized protein YycO
MTKFQAQCEHIALREQFWEIKYNPLQRAYGHFRMFFHSQETIEAANKGVRKWIAQYGNFLALKSNIEG